MDPAEGFAARTSYYKEAPFWSWNDWLTPAEARRQIDEMVDGGWGGFFMHARVGLETEYLGRDWMKVVKASVARAKKLGLCAWLYDENRWPSGFAGGAVPTKTPLYRAKYLLLSENLAEKGPNYKHLGSFRLAQGARGLEAKPVAQSSRVGGGRIIHFYQYTSPLGDPWFLGTSYVDLLEPETTREFIKTTHEKYKKAVGSEFGKAIPGIFTDEPSLPFPQRCPGPSLPWTGSLAKVFESCRGYDLTEHLPSLFLPCGDFRKVRYDFHRTVTEMFVESFGKKLYDWCDENGLQLTGHMMAEDSISSQIRFAGAVMPFYEYMHVPGIDHLGNNIDDPATVKQVSSVADQLGKPRVLSELYGCSGQDFNLKGRKWIADWHLALGVNLLNPHLWLYSLRGERKRDFPPTISCQQPHWPKSKTLSERNASLSYMLTRGSRVVDVLVVHPVESGWCDATPLDEAALEENDRAFSALVDELLSRQVDFHFGDESLLARHGSVETGKLIVGRCGYSAVVVPGCLTLRATTLELLSDFAAAGGKIIVQDRRPSRVNGAKGSSALLRRALGKAPVTKLARLAATLKRIAPQPVTITGRGARSILYHLRDLGGERLLFLANTDYDRAAEVTVTVSTGDAYAGMVDLASGAVEAVTAKRQRGSLALPLKLAEAQSALVALGARPYRKPRRKSQRRGKQLRLRGAWKVADFAENALTLDTVSVRERGGGWSEKEHVLFAAEKLQRARGRARVRYEFTVQDVPDGALHIAVERPGDWTISANGAQLKPAEKGYFLDREFRRIDVTGRVAPGRNVIKLAERSGGGARIESIYLVGRFGVYERGEGFCIGPVPTSVPSRDVTDSGFSFFAGVLDLEKEFHLSRASRGGLFLLDQLHAGAADVFINGKPAGELLYPPYEVATPALKAGVNTVRVRLYSTLRNLLGPHHFEGPESGWVSPGSFTNRKLWSDRYRFARLGFEGARIEP